MNIFGLIIDPYPMIIFLIHLFLISFVSYKITQRFLPDVLERVLAAFILVWANLVVTALLLSCFILLGNRYFYFSLSVLMTLVGYGIVYKKNPYPSIEWKSIIRQFFQYSYSLWDIFLFLTFLFFICVNIVIAFSFRPNGWDSLAYHLPRIYFYLGQGHLGHFTTGDFRMIFFPFNYELLQLLCVTYGQPDWLLNYTNLFCWIFAGIALFVICRRIGLKTGTALLSSWIGLTATLVLAYATITYNDLPTAVPLLIGVVFALRWFDDQHWKNVVFAGIAFGLSAGSKLTIFFFWPMGIIIPGFILYRIIKKKITLQQAFQGVRHWIVGALIAFILTAPFMMINYYYAKQLITPGSDFMLNRPFNWRSPGKTLYTYGLQLVFDPFQRVAIDMPGKNVTAGARNFLEPRVRKYLLPDWDLNYTASNLSILYSGLSEDFVWFGFAGPLVVLSVLWTLVSRPTRKSNVTWLGLASMIWIITYCIQFKWYYGIQRYFIGAFLLGIPCTGYFIETLIERSSIIKYVIKFCIVSIVLTSALFGYIYVMNKALLLLVDPAYYSESRQRSPRIRQELSHQKNINIVFGQEYLNFSQEHFGEKLYHLMDIGRAQTFRLDTVTRKGWYNIYSCPSASKEILYSNRPSTSSYVTIAIPDKKTPGVEFLDSIYFIGSLYFHYYGYDDGIKAADSLKNNNLIMIKVVFDGITGDGFSKLRLSLNGCRDADSFTTEVYYKDIIGNRTLGCTFTKDSIQSLVVPQFFTGLYVLVHEKQTGLLKGEGEIKVREFNSGQTTTSGTITKEDLIKVALPHRVLLDGFRLPEGPYPQWDLPAVRWANRSRVRLAFYSQEDAPGKPILLSMSFRPHIRQTALMVVSFNGKKLKEYTLTSGNSWRNDELQLTPKGGANTLEFEFPLMKNEKPLPDSLFMLFKTLSVSGF